MSPVHVPQAPGPWAPAWTQTLSDCPSRVLWHPSGDRLAAASLGGEVIVLDAASGVVVQVDRQDAAVLSAGWAGEEVVAGRMDGTLALGSQRVALTGWVNALAVAPGGGEAAVAHGRRFSAVDLSDPTRPEPTVQVEHQSTITAVAWHPTRRRVLVGSSNRLDWLDLTNGAVDPVPILWGGAIASLHPGGVDGWWVAGARGDWSYAWQLEAPWAVHALPVPRTTGELVALDAERARCVVASRSMTVLFAMAGDGRDDCPAGLELFSLGVPTAVTWHPHLPVLLCGVTLEQGDRRGSGILQWRPDVDPAPLGLSTTPAAVTQLAWSPDGSLVAVGLADGTVGVMGAGQFAPAVGDGA